ncbi:uncharacterized protein LOC130689233 [Daphnia carinata]|uniref:uncharacterized protein LOC130689233 n=1 Tax=Daphnia carinata TaxID=120202 RepID=UPI00257DA5AB|nr:uncharacterized protein LOC130689233 [Daphnia carinata]
MTFSAFHLLLLLLAPLIISARPTEPIESASRVARQLLTPVAYVPWAQPALVPDNRYGYNPLTTRNNVPLDDLESRFGLALLLLLMGGIDDRFTANRPLGYRPFVNRPRLEIIPQF